MIAFHRFFLIKTPIKANMEYWDTIHKSGEVKAPSGSLQKNQRSPPTPPKWEYQYRVLSIFKEEGSTNLSGGQNVINHRRKPMAEVPPTIYCP